MTIQEQQGNAACPEQGELVAFANGSAGDEFVDTIAEHIADCDTCVEQLRSLESKGIDQSFLDALGVYQEARDPFEPFRDEPEASRAIDRAKSIGESNFEGPVRLNVSESSDDEADKPTADWDAAQGQSPPTTTKLPAKIGKYSTLGYIARGGFGNVYKAKDPQSNRFVAIKVLRSDRTTPSRSDSLLEEARTAGSLDHPSIVKVFDWGRDNDGSCYIVLEYIDGTTLRDRMKAGPIEHERAAQIVTDIAKGLDYAHQREIYHRDVKPENILLRNDQAALLNDFGLAIHEAERWNYEGLLAGTPLYMAPEQVKGNAMHFDGRTDVWSLGVVFYELLTGRLPFSGNNEQLAAEIQEKHPRHPHSFDPEVPDALCAVCLKCLEKDPADRFDSAHKIAQQLEDWLHSRSEPTVLRRLILRALAAGSFTLAAGAALIVGPRLFRPAPTGDELVAGYWSSLLAREPMPIAWLPSPTSRHLHDDGSFTVIDIEEMCIFSCGRLASDAFSLRCSMSIDEGVSRGGPVFGIHEPEIGKMEGFAISVGRFLKDKRPHLNYLKIGMKETTNGNHYATVDRVTPISGALNFDSRSRAGPIVLEATIVDRRVKSVSLFHGSRLLTTSEPAELDRFEVGDVGLFSFGRLVVFHDYQIKPD